MGGPKRADLSPDTIDHLRVMARARYRKSPDAQRKRAYLRALRLRIKVPRPHTLERWGLPFTDETPECCTP
jgi:hypothetical protein